MIFLSYFNNYYYKYYYFTHTLILNINSTHINLGFYIITNYYHLNKYLNTIIIIFFFTPFSILVILKMPKLFANLIILTLINFITNISHFISYKHWIL